MTPERKEKEPSKKEKEGKRGGILQTFREIIERLKELEKKSSMLSTEVNEKRELEARRDGLIADFFAGEPEYNKRTKERRDSIGNVLDEALEVLEEKLEASEKKRQKPEDKKVAKEELAEQQERVRETISEQSEEAERHWETEPEDVKEEHKGVSEYVLKKEIKIAEKREERVKRRGRERELRERREKELSKGERYQVADNFAESVIQERENSGEEMTPEKKEEERKWWRERLGMPRRAGGYGYNENELERLQEDKDFRETEFRKFFYAANAQPQRDFWQTIDTDTRIKINQFFQTLSDPELGRDFSNIVAGYSEELALRATMHNVAWGVEYGGVKPQELPNHVRTFGSHQKEFLFKPERGKWVGKAARLYEKGFERLLDEDGFVEYSRVCLRPAEVGGETVGQSELDEWVYRQLRRTLRKEREVITKEDEWKVREAMALGKQHEIFTMKLVEIAARGRLPTEDKHGPGRMKSPWAEDYVRVFGVMEHYVEKFGVGDDVLAAFYFFIADKIPHYTNHEDLIREFKKLSSEEGERLADVLNVLGTGGPTTISTWRGVLAARGIKRHEDLRYLGTGLRLAAEGDRLKNEIRNGDFDTKGLLLEQTLKNEAWGEFLKEEGNKDLAKKLRDFRSKFPAFKERLKIGEASEEEIKEMEAITKKIQEFRRRIIWEEGLGTNPLQIVREGRIVEEKNGKSVEKEVAEELRERLDLDDKQEKAIREELAVLSEIAVSQKAKEIDTDYIDDPTLKANVDRYIGELEAVATEKPKKKDGKKKEKSVIERLAEKEVNEFKLGLSTSDVSWELLQYAETGKAADDRRIRDMAGADVVRENLTKFLNAFPGLKSEEAIAQAIYEQICVAIRAYDSDRAGEVARFLTNSISRFYLSDSKVRLAPWPIGLGLDYWRRNSAAEHLWGEEAMDWFKTNQRHFISVMAGLGALGSNSGDKAEKMFNKLKARRRDLGLEFVCRWTPLGVVMILALLVKEGLEELKQGLEEAA